MNNKFINWAIFCILSIVWGSSFILMKQGLTVLSAYQVASLRMLFSGLVLLPFAISSFKKIPKEKIQKNQIKKFKKIQKKSKKIEKKWKNLKKMKKKI